MLLLIDHGASPFSLSCTCSTLRRQLLSYVTQRRHVVWSKNKKITFNSTESVTICWRDKVLIARLTAAKPFFDAYFYSFPSRTTPLILKDCLSLQCIANVNVILIYARNETKSNFACAISVPNSVVRQFAKFDQQRGKEADESQKICSW